MATKIYADIRTALAHSRRVAHAPLRWDPVGHLLSRFGFGPTPRTRAAVAKNGLQWWVNQQIELGVRQGGYRAHKGVQAVGRQLTLSPYDAQQWLAAQGNQYGWTIMDQLTQVTLGLQAWSPAQLYESLVDFFSNHLNVPNHAGDMWVTRAPYDREVIRPWVMHDFTQHAARLGPASGDADVPQPRRVDEGRDQRELRPRVARTAHGRAALLRAGRAQRGVAADRTHGRPVPALRVRRLHPPDRPDQGPQLHERERQGDEAARRPATRCCATWPATRTRRSHLAQKMCVRFVSDNPSTTLVNAVASAYLDNGTKIMPMVQDHPVLERVLGEPRREGTASRRERRRVDPRVRRAGLRLREGDPGAALDHRLDEQRAARLAGTERLPGRRDGLAIGRKPAHRVGRPPRPRRRLVARLHRSPRSARSTRRQRPAATPSPG